MPGVSIFSDQNMSAVPMKTLLVLRHAKSDWSDDALDDHDRPLAPRGEQAAPAMGRHILRRGLVPALVLCSTARRARDTLALAAAEWPEMPPVRHDRELYLAGVDGILRRVAAVEDAADPLMVVGHNPDLQRLVLKLAGDGPAGQREAVRQKFPSGAFAAIELPISRWAELAPPAGPSGRLVDLATPKGLA